MSKVKPAVLGLDRSRTFTVLEFLDGMVMTEIDDFLFFYLRIGNVIYKRPADAAAFRCILQISTANQPAYFPASMNPS